MNEYSDIFWFPETKATCVVFSPDIYLSLSLQNNGITPETFRKITENWSLKFNARVILNKNKNNNIKLFASPVWINNDFNDPTNNGTLKLMLGRNFIQNSSITQLRGEYIPERPFDLSDMVLLSSYCHQSNPFTYYIHDHYGNILQFSKMYSKLYKMADINNRGHKLLKQFAASEILYTA